MNTNSDCYWNLLNNNEKRELVKKVTGLNSAPNEIVFAQVVPGIVETYLESHSDEIKPKYQVFVKNYKGADWEEYERPTFMLNLAFNWADQQFKEYSAYAVAVLDLFNEKLMAINY